MATILLADDDAGTRDFVRRALEIDGHSVKSVSDGNEALDALRATSGGFDLVISDVHMPGLDGIGLASALAAAHPGARMLLISGHPQELDRARAIAGLSLAGVAKPFTLDEIRTAVTNLLAS